MPLNGDSSHLDTRQDHLPARLGKGVLALLILALGYLISLSNYPLFHSLVEVISITISLGVFLLLWNARRFLEEGSFLVLGAALVVSGGIDLLHTLSYKGVNIFASPEPSNLATQFWIAGRSTEAVGWLMFAVLYRRRSRFLPLFIAFTVLAALQVVSILYWQNYPDCFLEGRGLTTFKITAEYVIIAVLLSSLILMARRSRGQDPEVTRYLLWAMALIALAEAAFTLYQDVYGFSNLLGHIFRIVSRYLLYLALIRLSVTRPYALFFEQLQRDKQLLAESEQRWRALSETSPDHIMDLDGDLNVRYANYSLTGRPMDQLLGLPILDLVSDERRETIRQLLETTLATGEPVSFETRFPQPSGQVRFYETKAAARTAADGRPQGLTLVTRNITERRQNDLIQSARLRIREAALTATIPQLLQKLLDEAEAITDSKIGFYHFVEADQDSLHLQSWSTRTLTEMCTAEFSDVHYPISEAGVWADAVRQRRPLIHNDYAGLPDKKGMPVGHAVIVRELVVPLLREGRVVAVLGVGNKESDYVEDDIKLVAGLADLAWDIVVRKRAEEALVESRRHLASTLANLPGMVFRCANDENWTFRFASESCRDLTGYDEHDLIGNRTISYAALIHPDDRPAVNDVVQEGIRENSSYQVTYRIIPREGPVKWVWEQGRGVTREGQVREIEGFIYDITDQVEAQQKRQAIEKKILESQKLESLGVLAGGIAHDFNNLLQAMLGFSEMIGVQIGPDHPAQQSLARVTEAASRAADLTRQMLAFSGRGQFSVSRVDLSRQVEAMANLLESSLPKSVSFHRELGADLPQVKLDTAQFQQVVMNMITNAAEAIGDQSGTIHLRTGTCQCDAHYLARSVVTGEMGSDPPEPGTYAYVEVQDSGCGMDQATIGRIFEPFFTTKFTGRGLGLAAVQGIMRGHAGALLIDSQVGVGTTIRSLFPAVATAGQGGAPVQVPPGAEDNSGQPLILVVEDEATVRQLVTSTLQDRGYAVAEATDGLEALEFMRRKGHQVEGILLDVVMPNMGGEEFLKNVREMKFMTRVILMSGFTREEMMTRFGGQEIVDYLAKPFRARQLLDVVSAIVPAPRS